MILESDEKSAPSYVLSAKDRVSAINELCRDEPMVVLPRYGGGDATDTLRSVTQVRFIRQGIQQARS